MCFANRKQKILIFKRVDTKLDNKTNVIRFRVTEEEYRIITNNAKMIDETVSEYMLSLVKKKRIVSVKEFSKLLSDISGCAVNINQIAKVANTQKFVNKKNVDNLLQEVASLKAKVDEILLFISEPETTVKYQNLSVGDIYDLLKIIDKKIDKLKADE